MFKSYRHFAHYFYFYSLDYKTTLCDCFLSCELARLLGVISGQGIHQRRAEGIVRLQANLVELLPHLGGLFGREPLLDDGADKGGKLGLLPAGGVAQLDVHKVEALEGVLGDDAAKQVDAALRAGVALDGGALVDDLELAAVGRHLEVVGGHNGDDGEEGTSGFPAFRALHFMSLVVDAGGIFFSFGP